MFNRLARGHNHGEEFVKQNNSHYMLRINKRELIDNISSKLVTIPDTDLEKLEATITTGYCVFDSYGEITNIKISMRDFYFNGQILTEDQENTLKKIVYIMHYDAKRNPKNPIAITEVKTDEKNDL